MRLQSSGCSGELEGSETAPLVVGDAAVVAVLSAVWQRQTPWQGAVSAAGGKATVTLWP